MNEQTPAVFHESTLELEENGDPEPDLPEEQEEPVELVASEELVATEEKELKAPKPEDCDDDLCNNGFCDRGHCRCEDGWDGEFCDEAAPPSGCISDDECHQGSCDKRRGRCDCDEGWDGTFCDVEKPPAQDDPPPDCAIDDECHHGRCDDGQCKCKDGWDGDTCDVERCGEVDGGCGKHGNCRHDKCECHDGWKGDDCDDTVTYQVKFITTSLDSRSRSADACGEELYEFMNMLDDESKYDKLNLDIVTVIDLPSECGDFSIDTTRSMLREVVDHVRDGENSKGHDNDDEPILIMLVFDEGSEKTADGYTCADNMEEAADEIANHMKPSDLKELDGRIVYMDYEDCGERKELEWRLHDEID